MSTVTAPKVSDGSVAVPVNLVSPAAQRQASDAAKPRGGSDTPFDGSTRYSVPVAVTGVFGVQGMAMLVVMAAAMPSATEPLMTPLSP